MAADKQRKVVKEITLREPVEFGDRLIERITVYKPRGKDMRVLLNPDVETATLRFMSKCTLTEEAILDLLDSDDWAEIAESVGELVERGQKIGRQG